MKHNTHIYIASKAIEFLQYSVDNLRCLNGSAAAAASKIKVKAKALDLQRLLRYHQAAIEEASWAPDDIIDDKVLYHTFKLFTVDEFPDAGKFTNETYVRNNKTYYRIKGGGGLPFKADHLSRIISDMIKLRLYNDHFTQKQIMYLYLMLSHYIVDAHVPMHCDLRDDPPSSPADTSKPGPKERYFPTTLHGQIEELWDAACTPAAVREKIVIADSFDDFKTDTNLTSQVTFSLSNKNDVKLIRPYTLSDTGLMDFMVDICVNSKERSLKLFPLNNPAQYDAAVFTAMTRDIFADAISDLITIYLWMWGG